MTLWTWIENHQSLSVGIIGFAGVIFTLLINASQARKQRRDVLRHDCETLRTALIEELKINRYSVTSNLDGLDDVSVTRGYMMPTDPMDGAFRAFMDRIDLLSQSEVGKVM
ncbi:MAG: hypothetical protein VCD33_13605 [Alphaproteobacteria bacterium]